VTRDLAAAPAESLWAVVRRMPSGAFAFVMATGIVSSAFDQIGWAALSIALLAIAVLALVALVVATLARLVAHRRELFADARDPKRAFGFFTIVAAINVVGIRLYSEEAPLATIVLALASVPIWLLLSYGLPSNLMLRPRRVPGADGTDGAVDAAGPVAADIDGSGFLWVVGTHSVAIAAAAIGRGTGDHALAAIAVGLWGVGVMLYIMLATLVTLRLLTVPSAPNSFRPSYWIYMGATAITVLAGSRILLLPHELPIVLATSPVVSGLTYVLWAFGAWWVPLLVIFGVWRHLVNREPVRYEAGLWSIVFPLGMYSVASALFGRVARLPLLVTIGDVGTWIAGVVWLVVAIAMVRSALRWAAARRAISREPGER
jgi:tellurite resistance protein TehA-like permease